MKDKRRIRVEGKAKGPAWLEEMKKKLREFLQTQSFEVQESFAHSYGWYNEPPHNGPYHVSVVGLIPTAGELKPHEQVQALNELMSKTLKNSPFTVQAEMA